jgi:DNA-binding PadR family transcriptional regulator
MTEIEVTNMVKFYTLLLLNKGAKHGYDIMKELNVLLGRKISASLVYPFLNTLKKHKYLAVKKLSGREKKTYEFTPKGKKFVKEIIERFGSAIDASIEQRLTVCIQCKCKVFSGAHLETIKGKKRNFCCKKCAESYTAEND